MAALSLTKAERSLLASYEIIIDEGLQSFVEVGAALMRIRDAKLYRDSHGTFEAYCKERWEFTDRYARMLIDSAGVAKRIGESGTIVPKTETQSRELARLPDEEQPAAWREAVKTAPKDDDGNPKITAAHVRSVVEKRLGPTIVVRTPETECEIPDSAIVGSHYSCPTCGQKWPEGRPVHDKKK